MIWTVLSVMGSMFLIALVLSIPAYVGVGCVKVGDAIADAANRPPQPPMTLKGVAIVFGAIALSSLPLAVYVFRHGKF